MWCGCGDNISEIRCPLGTEVAVDVASETGDVYVRYQHDTSQWEELISASVTDGHSMYSACAEDDYSIAVACQGAVSLRHTTVAEGTGHAFFCSSERAVMPTVSVSGTVSEPGSVAVGAFNFYGFRPNWMFRADIPVGVYDVVFSSEGLVRIERDVDFTRDVDLGTTDLQRDGVVSPRTVIELQDVPDTADVSAETVLRTPSTVAFIVGSRDWLQSPPKGLLRPTDELQYSVDVVEGSVQIQERTARGTYIEGQRSILLLPRLAFTSVPDSLDTPYSLADIPAVPGASLIRTLKDRDSFARQIVSYGWITKNARDGMLDTPLPTDLPALPRGELLRGALLQLVTEDGGALTTSASFGRL